MQHSTKEIRGKITEIKPVTEMNDRVLLSNATVKYCDGVSVRAKRRKIFGVQAE